MKAWGGIIKIIINGIHANLRFSSAHVIPKHDSCGCIHGHSYFVDIEVEGDRSGDFEFVVDFKDLKNSVRKLCKSLDHRILIPINNKNMKFNELDGDSLSVGDFKNMDYLEFDIQNKSYKFPIEDCVLLPLKHTSAEELSQYFANHVADDILSKGYKINSISACVNEGIGQGAVFKKEF